MDSSPEPTPRKRPSRGWYLLSLVLFIGSLSVFVFTLISKASYLKEQIAPMPRFVGPTGDDGFVVTIDQPGKQNIYYENLVSLDGKAFDTPRRQVWTTFAAPSMVCTVTHVETGEAIEVLLPGQRDSEAKSRTSEDQIVNYKIDGMQGHSAWVFEVEQAGDYRIDLAYNEAVYVEPGSIEIPPELTKAEKKKMLTEDGTIYEAVRREAIERAALAELEPIDVLFAVGPDPTRGSFFNVIGLKGAATVLAFGFTFAVMISLVTLMLRGGHVTPRGEIDQVRRFGQPAE
ncbi:MAG: hypothetical protein AAGB26_18380 [Planctomycetota bacterium]